MSHTHLTRDQRVELAKLLRLGHTQSQAAHHINVHRSTICRELQRNTHTNGPKYHAAIAKAKYRRQAANQRRYRLGQGRLLAD